MTTPATSPTPRNSTSGIADPISNRARSVLDDQRMPVSSVKARDEKKPSDYAHGGKGLADSLQEGERIFRDRLGDVIDTAGLAGQLDVARHGVGRQADDGNHRALGVVLESAREGQAVHSRQLHI